MSIEAADKAAALLPPVAIICGAGGFPAAVASAARERGQPTLLIGLRGIAEASIEAHPHEWIHLGEIGGLLKLLTAKNIRKLAFIGGLARPELSDLRLDWGAIKRLPDIARTLKGGDDHGLKGIIRIFENEGLEIVGVDAIAPQLLAGQGILTATKHSAQALDDAKFGFAMLDALSTFDAGQSAIIAQGRVIAIEAAEGTDAMLERAAQLRNNGRWKAKGQAGVLVKTPKRGQDLRIDMPAIGPNTIALAANAGLEGLCLAANQVLLLDKPQLVIDAKSKGLFILGIDRESANP